jgi:hypothetical protein
MLTINVRSNIKQFEKKLSGLAWKQLPFATAQALTTIAKKAADAEKANESKVLDRPRPFTQNSIRVAGATKLSQSARVFMMDIAARYLEPYEFGGRNRLNGKALLKPVDAVKDLDQYGNLPRNFMRSLKGRKDIFIGTVRTKRGSVSGVWQRSAAEGATSVPVARVGRDGKVRMGKTKKALNTSGHLKLLIRFADSHPVTQYLDWFGVAQRVVAKEFNREFGRALARAIATAK